ncbi:MAG: HWE histidine kinase domain-containing protein [Pacificimonas sp.]
MATAPSHQIDLTSCERERIHELGAIQNFGWLVAFAADGVVSRVSANIDGLFGMTAEDAIGKTFEALAGQNVAANLRGRIGSLRGEDSVERIFDLKLASGRRVDVALHSVDGLVVAEFERHRAAGSQDHSGNVRNMIDRLSRAQNEAELVDMAAEQVKSLTGFDRVMVYRLSNEGDGDGEVVAEAAEDGLESFHGLRYPASDIPVQARRLYLRSLLRIISDIDGEVVPILPNMSADGRPLNLSLSSLRAVSPVHLQYLGNMGVRASMSISIILNGKLWGLIACHHYSAPRILDYHLRSAAELFGQLFSFALAAQQNQALGALDDKARQLHDRLMGQLASGESLEDQFDFIVSNLRDVVDCDGVAMFVDGTYKSEGTAPDEDGFRLLAKFLSTNAAGRIFMTDRLGEIYPEGAEVMRRSNVAGILVVPISRHPRDYLVCCRREVVETVTWAGDPNKPVEVIEGETRLLPRSSFKAWSQEMRDRSRPWAARERRAAEWLRVTLLEVVLKMADRARKAAEESAERQELLIAELNHRVRNILTLIRGVISQSRGEGDDVSGFTEKIGGRIHALARAHDQITQEQWAPASLVTLIETEAEAYLSEKSDRVRIDGPSVLLSPTAFTTVSLVIHELLTNSAKYGALADSHGHINVAVSRSARGDLELSWTESGGPPVQAPTRKGFGTTIIDRSIPFQLKGEAKVRFDVTGLRADFVVPNNFITWPDGGDIEDLAPPAPVTSGEKLVKGDVLIVEDNMIIAMDVEDLVLKNGGASAFVASNVAEALRLINERPFEFALLDVNLGSETSEPIAEALAARGIRFAFMTGYGGEHGMTDRYPDAPVLQKPVDEGTFAVTLLGVEA